jgi:hypothetical protein
MPAGSGPVCTTPITSGSITTGANSVTITTGPFNTGAASGMLINVYLTWTPSATQTIACKLFQTATTGTQVGPGAGLLATGTGTTTTTTQYTFLDNSAFAQNAAGAVYVVGFTGSTGTGTIIYAFVELETTSALS